VCVHPCGYFRMAVEQKLSHVTAGRPKVNRRSKKKRRKGLRKAFETADDTKSAGVPSTPSKKSMPLDGASSNLKKTRSVLSSISAPQLEAITSFKLPTLQIKKVDSKNVSTAVVEMQSALNRLIIAEKKLELMNHALRTDVNLMQQRALKLEEEFCYRYKSAKQDEAKVKQFVGGSARVLGDSKSSSKAGGGKSAASAVRYYQSAVQYFHNNHWKPRYFILTERYVETYKTDKPPKEGTKPHEVLDLAGANIANIDKHAGMDRPCLKLTTTGRKAKVAMFYCNNANDNNAWYSGISNRRLQCSYEEQSNQLKATPSESILKFLAQWRFASAPVTLDMKEENLDVLSAGIINKCLCDPSQPSNPIAQLKLSSCVNLNDIKMNDISVGLFTNKSVRKLDLSKTKMSVIMTKSLAKALEQNNIYGGQLRSLVLDDCTFEGKSSSTELFEGLNKSALTTLSLQRCHLDDSFAKALGEGIGAEEKLKVLSSINLNGNLIGDEGALAISNGLEENQVLLVLNLVQNKIGDDGGVALAKALRKNTKLESLYFKGNPIQEGAIAAFTRTAQVNSCLRNLSYSDSSLHRQHMVMSLFARSLFRYCRVV